MNGYTPLHYAAHNCRLDSVSLMLDLPHVDVNITSQLQGKTPLHEAANVVQTYQRSGFIVSNATMVRWLLANGADKDAQAKNGNTASMDLRENMSQFGDRGCSPVLKVLEMNPSKVGQLRKRELQRRQEEEALIARGNLLVVSILLHHEVDGNTEYIIKSSVSFSDGLRHSFFAGKRFSEFQKLHNGITQVLTKLPSAFPISGGPSFMVDADRRVLDLEKYLRLIMENADTMKLPPDLKRFLLLPNDIEQFIASPGTNKGGAQQLVGDRQVSAAPGPASELDSATNALVAAMAGSDAAALTSALATAQRQGVSESILLNAVQRLSIIKSLPAAPDLPTPPPATPAVPAAGRAAMGKALNAMDKTLDDTSTPLRAADGLVDMAERSGIDKKMTEALNKGIECVWKGTKIADMLLRLGERSGIPLLGSVCGAARDVLTALKDAKTKVADAIQVGYRVVDMLELLERMAHNVVNIDAQIRSSVESRMGELTRLLKGVEATVVALGNKGWLKRTFGMYKEATRLSKIDAEMTKQLDTLLKYYQLARDAHMDARLQAREYAVEAEVEKQIKQREAMGEPVDVAALQADTDLMRSVAVASGLSEAEFKEELGEMRAEMREQFGAHGLKLDEIKQLLEKMSVAGKSTSASKLASYTYEPLEAHLAAGKKGKSAAKLGSGGFGATYCMKKKDGIDARRYAVKMIQDQDSNLVGADIDIEKEAQLLSMLDHPSTVRLPNTCWHFAD